MTCISLGFGKGKSTTSLWHSFSFIYKFYLVCNESIFFKTSGALIPYSFIPTENNCTSISMMIVGASIDRVLEIALYVFVINIFVA